MLQVKDFIKYVHQDVVLFDLSSSLMCGLFCFEGIVKYMKAQVGPSSKEVTSIEELDKYLNAEPDVTVVGFFEKETELKGAFLKVADKLREKVRFAHTSFKALLDKYEVR